LSFALKKYCLTALILHRAANLETLSDRKVLALDPLFHLVLLKLAKEPCKAHQEGRVELSLFLALWLVNRFLDGLRYVLFVVGHIR